MNSRVIRSDTSTLGDVNSDGKVDAKDASLILLEYAQASTGAEAVIAEYEEKLKEILTEDQYKKYQESRPGRRGFGGGRPGGRGPRPQF